MSMQPLRHDNPNQSLPTCLASLQDHMTWFDRSNLVNVEHNPGPPAGGRNGGGRNRPRAGSSSRGRGSGGPQKPIDCDDVAVLAAAYSGNLAPPQPMQAPGRPWLSADKCMGQLAESIKLSVLTPAFRTLSMVVCHIRDHPDQLNFTVNATTLTTFKPSPSDLASSGHAPSTAIMPTPMVDEIPHALKRPRPPQTSSPSRDAPLRKAARWAPGNTNSATVPKPTAMPPASPVPDQTVHSDYDQRDYDDVMADVANATPTTAAYRVILDDAAAPRVHLRDTRGRTGEPAALPTLQEPENATNDAQQITAHAPDLLECNVAISDAYRTFEPWELEVHKAALDKVIEQARAAAAAPTTPFRRVFPRSPYPTHFR